MKRVLAFVWVSVWVSGCVGVWVLVIGTRLCVRRAASMLPVPDRSSTTNTEDTLICFIRSAMCGSAVRARVRNGDATTGCCGTFQYGTRHAVHGTDGSDSHVKTNSTGTSGPVASRDNGAIFLTAAKTNKGSVRRGSSSP